MTEVDISNAFSYITSTNKLLHTLYATDKIEVIRKQRGLNRLTNCPSLPRTERFPVMGNLQALKSGRS